MNTTATRSELLAKVQSSDLYRQYVETALWSSTDINDENGDGEPLDENFSLDDLAETTLIAVIEDCDNFYALIFEEGIEIEHDLGQFGYDFWLTRNGHGAGFWDGDWKEGDALTKWAKTFGSVDWYAGDDGLIYQA